MLKVAILLLLAFFVCLAQSAPQLDSYGDTPRTGSKWPPYENAGKDFWQLEFEKSEKASLKVKKDTKAQQVTETKQNQEVRVEKN